MKWDEYFMMLAETVSLKSKDRSTKVGAVVVGPDHELLSSGFNGFPRGVDDDHPGRDAGRERKYLFTAHAEANAVFQAARHGVRLKGASIYITHPPCAECAKAIIQAGIIEVWYRQPEDPAIYQYRWGESFAASSTMFREAEIKVICIPRT